jgi:hypothetical protein
LSARRRKESALADLRQIEVKRRRGELIEVARVKAIVEASARAYRDSWLNLAARVSGPLAAQLGVGGAALETALEDMIRRHLSELADWTQAGGAFD